jgi:putative DNA primase/helicase
MELTQDAAIHLAPSDVAADAIRNSILAGLKNSSCSGDAFLELLRCGAMEIATLATVWHEPAESFSMLLEAGTHRGVPPGQARGILIGAFGCDPTQHQPIVPCKLPSDQAFITEARRRMATTHDGNRLLTFQHIALDCGALVSAEEISRTEGADLLMDLAQSNGLTDTLRTDDLQHVLSEAFQGRAAIPDRPASALAPQSKEKPIRGRRLVVRCAADIVPEPITWLWTQRIAIGKLTLLAGEPGRGKSQVMAALAAATTTGGPWPCNEGFAPLGSVIVLSAEDDPADTQIPRLLAAGADCRRVQIITAVTEKDAAGNRTFNIQADLDLIERELDRIGDVTLFWIDPLSSYLGKVDSHNNTEVRAVLERLSEMAARRRVAIVGVTHFNKGDGSAINKIIGSIAFVAAARGAWMIATDPSCESRRLFVSIKNNVGRQAPALAFRIAQVGVGEDRDIIAPFVVWDPEPVSDTTADQVLAAAKGGEHRAANAEAAELLLFVLATGPAPVEAIQAEAVAAGLLKEGAPVGKDKTFRIARSKLGITRANGTVYREGGAGSAGQWFWRLPTDVKLPQNA